MQVSTSDTAIALLECPATADLIYLPVDPALLPQWTSWLTDDERLRLSGYRRRKDQQLFVARRGLARECIAKELSLAPQSIRLMNQPSGKLDWNANDFDYGPRAIDFSVSRTAGCVAAVVSRKQCVGIDVERISLLPEIETLAIQNLHPIELKDWLDMPETSRLVAYYRLWVVKEAFAKALGVGLTLPPRDILANEAMNNTRGKVESILSPDQSQEAEFWLKPIGTDRVLSVVVL